MRGQNWVNKSLLCAPRKTVEGKWTLFSKNFHLDLQKRVIYIKHIQQFITRINLGSYKKCIFLGLPPSCWLKISGSRDQKSLSLTSLSSNSDNQSILGTTKGKTKQKVT